MLVARNFDDRGKQERIVESIRWVSSRKRSKRGRNPPSFAVAVTSRIDQDDKQVAEYPCTCLDMLIDHYSAYYGKNRNKSSLLMIHGRVLRMILNRRF